MTPLASKPTEPLADPQAGSAIESLARRWARAALVLEASCRRRDVRELRARILLALLELRCPLGVRPHKRWYVPGAVARLGAEGLRRTWRSIYGGEAPALRTLRAHLGELEACLLLIRAPGDLVPVLEGQESPHRPRYPDTLHLLEDDQQADWWALEGRSRLLAHPEARRSAGRWALVIGDWRRQAARQAREPLLPFPEPAARARAGASGAPGPEAAPEARQAPPAPLEEVALLERAARVPQGAAELLAACAAAGAQIRGPNSWRMASDPRRLAGAMALLARALRRGDRIRSRGAWLVRAWAASPPEHAEALARLARPQRPRQERP